ncbi:unnamed protein product [Aphanomyces euteiches]
MAKQEPRDMFGDLKDKRMASSSWSFFGVGLDLSPTMTSREIRHSSGRYPECASLYPWVRTGGSLIPEVILYATPRDNRQAALRPRTKKKRPETRSLDELYATAVAEGGNLINFTIITDYSKFQDVRIDNQLATNSLDVDVASLQTLEDFPRWEKEGKLLAYNPAGFSQIYAPFKSSTGAWWSRSTITFSLVYDPAQLNASKVKFPKTPADLVDPIYKNLIASPYPHDDDAVLFVYSKYVEKYGWDWVAKFAQQNVQFKRGTNTPGEAIDAGNKSIGVSVWGQIIPESWYKLTFITKDIPYLSRHL